MSYFFNPLSKKSGINFQRHHDKSLLETEITDKTIGEHISDLWNFEYPPRRPNKYTDEYNRAKASKYGSHPGSFDAEGSIREFSKNTGWHHMTAVYASLMGVHYDNTIKDQNMPDAERHNLCGKDESGELIPLNMKEGAKGLLDLLIFPLIARKLLTDCRQFVRDEGNYKCAPSYDLINKAAGWLLLPVQFGVGLTLEFARHVIPVALFTAYVIARTAIIMAALIAAALLFMPVGIVLGGGYLMFAGCVGLYQGISGMCRDLYFLCKSVYEGIDHLMAVDSQNIVVEPSASDYESNNPR